MAKETLIEVVKDEAAKKRKKTFKFESDNKSLYIYPNVHFINGKYETQDEKLAEHIRQFDLAREVTK